MTAMERDKKYRFRYAIISEGFIIETLALVACDNNLLHECSRDLFTIDTRNKCSPMPINTADFLSIFPSDIFRRARSPVVPFAFQLS